MTVGGAHIGFASSVALGAMAHLMWLIIAVMIHIETPLGVDEGSPFQNLISTYALIATLVLLFPLGYAALPFPPDQFPFELVFLFVILANSCLWGYAAVRILQRRHFGRRLSFRECPQQISLRPPSSRSSQP